MYDPVICDLWGAGMLPSQGDEQIIFVPILVNCEGWRRVLTISRGAIEAQRGIACLSPRSKPSRIVGDVAHTCRTSFVEYNVSRCSNRLPLSLVGLEDLVRYAFRNDDQAAANIKVKRQDFEPERGRRERVLEEK